MNKKLSHIAAVAIASAISAHGAAAQGIVPRGQIGAIRADASSVMDAIDGINRAFAQFKEANNKEIEELRQQGRVSSDTQAKVETINADLSKMQAALDTLTIQMAGMGGSAEAKVRDAEYTESFMAHFRRGEVQAALNKGANEDGGYLTPIEWDRTITDALVLVSPMRQICRVQPTGKSAYSKLFNMHGTESGWVGEEDARPETSGPKFKQLIYKTGEIYANPSATQQMLDDAEIDLEAWLAAEVELEFAVQEGRGFLTGTGDKMPTGLLTYIDGNENAGVHPLGPIKTVDSGDANGITADAIYDLIYDLPSIYTGNARFTMNRTTMGKVRKLKDNMGNYLWQPSLVAGQPSTLAGYAITELPDMPDVAAASTPIVFGDFMRGYLINDRVGVRVLRDPYSNKPNIGFYTTKRVGGGVLTPEVFRALKVGEAAAA